MLLCDRGWRSSEAIYNGLVFPDDARSERRTVVRLEPLFGQRKSSVAGLGQALPHPYMEGTDMEERTRLIQQLAGARDKMRALLADVDTRSEIYPHWTIKQVLAHIAGWDDACVASLRAHAAGNEPGVPAARGINPYNAQSVETREPLSYDQVVKEWELARGQFETAINEMPPEKFGERFVFPWGPTGTIAELVAIFAEHEEEHAEEIRKLMTANRGEDDGASA
jgi:hypothetical protein